MFSESRQTSRNGASAPNRRRRHMIEPSKIHPNLIAQIAPQAAEVIGTGIHSVPSVHDDMEAIWADVTDQLRQKEEWV